jgi:hypothetical protein
MTDRLPTADAPESLTILDGDDRPVLRIGLLATLFFENGHQRDVREAVIECFEDYCRITGSRLRWTTHRRTHRWMPVQTLPGDQREWLLDLDPDVAWQLTYQGGESHEEASDYRFEAVGVPAWESALRLSYLQVCLPLAWYADHDGSFPELVLDFCQRLRPIQGYGGIGVIESYATAIRQPNEPTVFAMAQRFPGLEVDYPIAHSSHLQAGIKGVNWLTVLGDPWLSKVGGAERLAAELGPEYTLASYGPGVIVQAGAVPQLGDRNRDSWPDLYVKLARILRPIRITEHRFFHEYGPARFDDESTRAWLARFDRRPA